MKYLANNDGRTASFEKAIAVASEGGLRSTASTLDVEQGYITIQLQGDCYGILFQANSCFIIQEEG
jgi:hypothetical protein